MKLLLLLCVLCVFCGCCCQPKVWPAVYAYDNPAGVYPP
jgi:hypothetical protein